LKHMTNNKLFIAVLLFIKLCKIFAITYLSRARFISDRDLATKF
jgi:hypothetical protein